MPLTFAIALERIGRQARLGFIERRDDGVNFFEEALQRFQQRRMLSGAHYNLAQWERSYNLRPFRRISASDSFRVGRG